MPDLVVQTLQPTRRVLNPMAVLQVLAHRAWLVLICAATVAAICYAAARQFPNQYVASGDLVVDSRPYAIPELQGAVSGPASPDPLPSVRTEAIELTSGALLEQVVRELHLNENPALNPRLRRPGLLSTLQSAVDRIIPGAANPPAERPDADVALAAKALSKVLTVFYDNRSLVIAVSATLPDPDLAAKIVNTVMRLHLEDRAKQREAENATANAALMHRIEAVRKEVDDLDQQLSKARAQAGLINLPAGSMAQQRVSELATAADKATNDRVKAEAALRQANELVAAGKADQLADVLSSPTISRLREREAIAAGRVADLAASFGASYPPRRQAENELRRAQSEIASEVKRVVRSLQAQLAEASGRETAAKAALADAGVEASRVSTLQSQMSQLEREITSRRAMYQTLLQNASQTALQPDDAKTSPGVHIGAPATVPVEPTSPQPKLAALMGGLGGAMLGCFLALLGGISSRFRSPAEMAALLDLPLLGTAPTSLLRRSGQGLPLTAEQANAFGRLRVYLRRLAIHRGIEIRTVNIVSVDRGDGFALARRFAKHAADNGERVLLIAPPGRLGRRRSAVPMTKSPPSAPSEAFQRDSASMITILGTTEALNGSTDESALDSLRRLIREESENFNLVVMAAGDSRGSAIDRRLAILADYTVVIVDKSRARWSAVTQRIDDLRATCPQIGLLVLTDKRKLLAAVKPSTVLSANP